MPDDGDIVAARPAQRTSIASLLLHIGYYSTFRNRAEREHIADGKRGVLASVDKLPSVHAFVGDEGLLAQFVVVWVAEDDSGERGATSCIVDDLLHYTADVAMFLGKIECSKACWCLVETSVGCKDRATALSLISYDTTL